MSSVLPAILLLKKKADYLIKEELRKYFMHLDEIPSDILNPINSSGLNKNELAKIFINYVTSTTTFAIMRDQQTLNLMLDVGSNYKHCDIDAISFVDSFPSLIGLDFEQYTNLLGALTPALTVASILTHQ